MSVHPAESFEDETQRAIYEYVERHGAVTTDELARSVEVDDGRAQSKPARSGTYTENVPLEPEQLRASVAGLKNRGYVVETDGKLRVALSAAPTEHDVDGGTVTIRPAREEDRESLVETMRTVGSEGTYVVAENVAEQVQRETALVRFTEEASRVFFVATFEPDGSDAADLDAERDEELVGWLHVDAPQLETLSHTAELTVGVLPDHRREGIGSALLEYGLEWAADEGYRKVTQNVPATNERAIAFLEENGWKREGVREEQYCLGEAFVDEVLLATWP